MKCPFCGASNSNTEERCGYCGASLHQIKKPRPEVDFEAPKAEKSETQITPDTQNVPDGAYIVKDKTNKTSIESLRGSLFVSIIFLFFFPIVTLIISITALNKINLLEKTKGDEQRDLRGVRVTSIVLIAVSATFIFLEYFVWFLV